MREVTFLDHAFIHECYKQWPVTATQPPVLESNVTVWIRHWMDRDYGERCLLMETDAGPKGIITWRQNFFVAKIDNVVVHPLFQGKGFGSAMWRELQAKLESEGVVVCEFDALPGKVSNLVHEGRFEKVSEGIGEHTGLPIVSGRVKAGMKT